MLGHLMKYEFKASGRILLPLYGAVMILAILSGVMFKFASSALGDMQIFGLLSAVLFFVYVIFVVACSIVGVIMAVLRFKKNLFSNEGYLMHTLPVSTEKHIFSKLIVACTYEIAGVVTAFISAMFIALLNADFSSLDFAEFKSAFDMIFSQYTGATVVYGIEMLLMIIVGLIYSNLLIYAAISIGHSTSNHKIRNSFGAYIILYLAVQFLNSIALTTPIIQAVVSNFESGIYSMSLLLAFLIIINLVYSTVFFVITRYYIKNKLNLQ